MPKKSCELHIRLTPEERDRLDEQVKLSGLTCSNFVRLRLNGKMPQPIPPQEFHQMWQELSALKQEVQALHTDLLQSGRPEDAEKVGQLSAEILSQMRQIYQTVYRNISSD